MNHRRTLFCIIVLLGVGLFISGCAGLGPQFQKVNEIPNGISLVYIYRPSSIWGGGISYDVKTGEDVITTLYNGGYYPYFAKPGETEFWARTESKSSVTLDLKAGQVYYIKGTVGIGFIVGRPHLIEVTAEEAEREIADCKLIPEKK